MKRFQFHSLHPAIIFAILPALFTLSSCRKQTGTNPDNHAARVWDCTGIEPDKIYDISSDLPSHRLLELEENGNSTIGSVNKIITADSLLFVIDSNLAKRIFIFNLNTGKAIRSFGDTGSGPEEYSALQDVSYDEDRKLLYALCDNKKILTFNLKGEITGTAQAPYPSHKMEYDNNLFYFYSEDINTGEITVTDTAFNVLESFFPNKDNPLQHRMLHPLMKSPQGELTYIRYMDNNIYQLHGTDSPKIRYTIDFGTDMYDRAEAEEDGEEGIKRKLGTRRGQIKYFVENSRYATILFFDRKEPCISMFDKQTGTSRNAYVRNVSEEMFGMLLSPIEYATDSCLIQVIDAATIPGEIMADKSIAPNENPMLYFMK